MGIKSKENILITICARKNSRRLPGKNIKNLFGKPLIQWTYDQAVDFKKQIKDIANIDIIISTDYDLEELKFENIKSKMKDFLIYDQIKKQYFFYLNRVDELCKSDICKVDVIKNAYDIMNEDYYDWIIDKDYYDWIIDLDVTSPLRKNDDILKAFNKRKYINSTLFSVCKGRRHPWFNQVINLDGKIKTIINPKDLESYMVNEALDLNASIYIYNPKWLESTNSNTPICEDSILYPMEDWQRFDIDSEDDWDIVWFLFAKHILEGNSEILIGGINEQPI